mgnify:CR=1 FL=1
MVKHVSDVEDSRGKVGLFCVDAAKIIAVIQFAAAMMVAGVWMFGRDRGVVGAFDRVALPSLAVLLLMMSGAAVLWPRFALGRGDRKSVV